MAAQPDGEELDAAVAVAESEADVVAAAPVAIPDTPRTFAAFGIPAFRLLWINTFLFALVQSTQRFALVWLVLDRGDGSGSAGLVLFAVGIPIFAVALPAGALSDRVDRRTLLIGSQLGALAVTLATAAAIAADVASVPVVIVLAVALGTSLAFGQPVRQAVLPSLVPRERLMNAIVLTTMGMNVSMIVGPALGGAAIALWGIGGAFTFQAVIYAVGLLALLRLRLEAPRAVERRRMRVEIGEGLQFVRDHREIRALFLLLAASGTFMLGPYQALVPQIARDELGQDAFGASVLFVMLGIGMATTSIVLAARRDVSHKGAWFAGGLVMGGIVQAGLGLSPWYTVTLVLMFVWGVGGGLFMNLNQTLIQSHTPQHVMGRVMSLHTLAMVGLSPLGALAGGAAAAAVGAPVAVAVCGFLMSACAALVLIRVASLRTMT